VPQITVALVLIVPQALIAPLVLQLPLVVVIALLETTEPLVPLLLQVLPLPLETMELLETMVVLVSMGHLERSRQSKI
jgi:hypothetical protein